MITETVWLWGGLSIIAVSLVSLIAVFLLSVSTRRLKRITFILVALAVGTLLGDSFIHLIPESIEKIGAEAASLWVLVGIFLFFIIEKVFRWHHDHHIGHEDCDHTVGYINLVSDGLHNFVDGILIAVSYIVSVPIGIATTVAVFLHEIPQEISDFGILLHAGFSRSRAIFYNFLSALAAVGGFVGALLVGTRIENFVSAALPITAGGFIYIAMADLIPELHENSKSQKVLVQLLMIAIGLTLMYTLTFFE